MALARQVLKTLPGVDRPAMVTAIPTLKGPCLLLDLGANVDCTAEQLYQAADAALYQAKQDGKNRYVLR